MSERRKHLRIGMKPHDTQRVLLVSVVGVELVLGLFCLLLGAVGVSAGFFMALIFGVSIPGIVVGLVFSKNIVVLIDGLEIGNRFVPFASIKNVTIMGSTSVYISYRYHGVDFDQQIVFTRFSRVDVDGFARELREACGLSDVEESEAVPLPATS